MIRQLLLAAVGSVLSRPLSAGVVQLPIHGSVAEYYESYAQTSDLDCAFDSINGKQKLCYNLLQYLTVDVTVGNPGQRFNLTLSSYAYDTKLFRRGAKDSVCIRNGNAIGGRRLFDDSRSTTFRSDRNLTYIDAGLDWFFQVNCADDEDENAKGIKFTDDFRVGKSAVKSVPAYLYTSVDPTIQTFWPSDGILGIMPGGIAPNAAVKIASSVGSSEMTLYLNRKDDSTQVGTLTVGGKDAVNCAKDWTRYSQGDQSTSSFNVAFNKFRVGETLLWSNASVAIFEPDQVAIGVPNALLPVIAKLIGATYDNRTQFYTVPCSKRDSLPALSFDFAGLRYRIPAVDYVRNLVTRKDDQCTVLLNMDGFWDVQPNETEIHEWSFGLAALRRYCWNINFGDTSVSLAKAI